ncbi:hypothetical protein GmHk_02G006046 [Glycine max]|nr:hypothetical protein GmHk_02G006046 [Glycine max]
MIFWNALKSRPPWTLKRVIHQVCQNLFHSQLLYLNFTNQLHQLLLRYLNFHLSRRFLNTTACRRRRPKILPVLIVVGGVSDPRLAPQAIAHFVNCDES